MYILYDPEKVQWIPNPSSETSATATEPVVAFRSIPPRIFRTEQHAKTALTHWLRGKAYANPDSDSKKYGTGRYGAVQLEYEPCPERAQFYNFKPVKISIFVAE